MIEVKIRHLKLDQDVVIAPYIEDEDLPAIYNLADLLVYPSLLEGFGLPIVEAMRCGTPVIASAIPALEEVAGGAALLVEPLDVPALASAMYRLLTDDTLRADLIQRGLERCRVFTWDLAAKEVSDLYKLVVKP